MDDGGLVEADGPTVSFTNKQAKQYRFLGISLQFVWCSCWHAITTWFWL